MPRLPRELKPGYSYHITSRCNNREFRLTRRECRELLLYAIKKALHKFQFKLYGLCIMSDRVHYLLEPAQPEDLPKIMHWLNWYTAMCFNRMLNRTGHFWEKRYHSTGFSNTDLTRALGGEQGAGSRERGEGRGGSRERGEGECQAGSREQGAGSREKGEEQGAGSWEKGAGSWELGVGRRDRRLCRLWPEREAEPRSFPGRAGCGQNPLVGDLATRCEGKIPFPVIQWVLTHGGP